MISTIAFLPNPIWLVQLRIFYQFVEISRTSRMCETPNYSLDLEPHPQACWPLRHCEGYSLKEKTLCNSIDLLLCTTYESDRCHFGLRVSPLLNTELGVASWVSSNAHCGVGGVAPPYSLFSLAFSTFLTSPSLTGHPRSCRFFVGQNRQLETG